MLSSLQCASLCNSMDTVYWLSSLQCVDSVLTIFIAVCIFMQRGGHSALTIFIEVDTVHWLSSLRWTQCTDYLHCSVHLYANSIDTVHWWSSLSPCPHVNSWPLSSDHFLTCQPGVWNRTPNYVKHMSVFVSHSSDASTGMFIIITRHQQTWNQARTVWSLISVVFCYFTTGITSLGGQACKVWEEELGCAHWMLHCCRFSKHNESAR